MIGGADGAFGPFTRAAVRAFQRANGLTVTGRVDAATASALGAGGSRPSVTLTTPTPAASRASNAGAIAVAAAMSQRGVAYRFATAKPGIAFDCSGLTAWAWAQAGVRLPFQSALQYATIPHVPAMSARPGDLVFFHSPISHVAMYIGNNRIIDAMQPGTGVIVRDRQLAVRRRRREARVTRRRGAVCATAVVLALAGVASTAGPMALTATAATASSSSIVGLRLGDRGPGVTTVQQRLTSRGYVLPVDGVFGPRTDRVLRSFQASSGLNPTGVVTENTARFLGLGAGAPSAAHRHHDRRRPAPPHRPRGSPAATAIVGLKLGDHGAAVRQLQTALLGQGFVLSNGADGVFGRSTEHAVALVQRFNQLPQTGVVSSATARALGLGTAPPATSTTTHDDAGERVPIRRAHRRRRRRPRARSPAGAGSPTGSPCAAAPTGCSARPPLPRCAPTSAPTASATPASSTPARLGCSASASPQPHRRRQRRAGSPRSASAASASSPCNGR